jgi:hypothetical protein
MPTIILYAVEIAEMERWVGSRDTNLLREAKAIVREDEDADWEREELELLDRLLERMIQEGRLYEGLGPDETYYLTQLLIDLFDELVESEAVSEEMPLEALDQALGQLRPESEAIAQARRWLTRGRRLGSDHVLREGPIDEDELPYFGYLRHAELGPVAGAAGSAPRAPARGSRDRSAAILKQLAAAFREAQDTERDLLSLVG